MVTDLVLSADKPLAEREHGKSVDRQPFERLHWLFVIVIRTYLDITIYSNEHVFFETL